jgi:hypothetical protein
MVFLIPQGGLGNLILQHNAAYAFSRDHDQPLVVLSDGREFPDRPNIVYYSNLFRHVTFTGRTEGPMYKEPRFMYDPIPENVKTIEGYFQSWKYFSKYEIEIRDLFVSNERSTYDAMKHKYEDISQNKPTTCVHIRRGDYLNNPTIHQLVDEDFFDSVIDRSRRLLVFSDSMDMIRDWKMWEGCDVHFVEDVPGALETLFLMSLCNDFVISNSTLSLCAYYLRADRGARLTVSSQWFGPDGPTYDIEDIVPPGTNIVNEPLLIFYTCMANVDKWKNNTCNGIIVTGDPNLTADYSWNPYTRRLIVRCKDDYEGLPHKTFQMIRAVKELFNPRTIIKQDDDVLLNPEKFESFRQLRHQYFGKVCVVRQGYMSTYKNELFKDKSPVFIRSDYCGGPLYGLGYHAIRALCENMNPASIKYEDVNVGHLLNCRSIVPVNIPWTYTHDLHDMKYFAGYCE